MAETQGANLSNNINGSRVTNNAVEDESLSAMPLNSGIESAPGVVCAPDVSGHRPASKNKINEYERYTKNAGTQP